VLTAKTPGDGLAAGVVECWCEYRCRAGRRPGAPGRGHQSLCERFAELHLIGGDRITATVPTYRGEGQAFG
jgi:hypothetical protein